MIHSIEELLDTDWMEEFGPRDLERGFDYAERNDIRILRVEERAILTECQGSGDSTYQQVIKLTRYRGYDSVHYECSCPVGSNCKHCAAVTFHLLGNPQALQTGSAGERLSTELEAWISHIPAPGPGSVATGTTDARLFYKLQKVHS